MQLEFLMEERSTEEVLNHLVPRILRPGDSFRVHTFQGKHDLMGSLLSRLRAYRNWLPPDWRIIVLVDQDADDCYELKLRLDAIARCAGLTPRSDAHAGVVFHVLNRIVIEELEAWFFGDPQALVAAYPGVPESLAKRRGFRDPDRISGGTWERLERVLQRAGYYPTGMQKLAVARAVSAHMDPERNSSHSFRVFWSRVLELLESHPRR